MSIKLIKKIQQVYMSCKQKQKAHQQSKIKQDICHEMAVDRENHDFRSTMKYWLQITRL
jgi:hypothetical protein